VGTGKGRGANLMHWPPEEET